MATTSALRKRLGPTRKRLTDLLDEIKNQPIVPSRATLLIDRLNKYAETFHSIKDQLQVLAKDNPSELQRLEDEEEEFINIWLDVQDAEATLGHIITSGNRAPDTNCEENSRGNYGIKLFDLKLAKFEGDITKWQGFWDSFESAVGNNPKLSPIDKLNYLRGQLGGPALRCVEGLALSNINYDVAVGILKDRFGDRKVIVEKLYKDLHEIRPSKNKTDVLRSTLDSIETILRSLEALGEEINHAIFAPIIKSKFPMEIILKVEEKLISREVDSYVLRSCLNEIITIREKVSFLNSPHSNSESPLYSHPTANSLPVNEIKCVFCDECHWSDECREYLTLDSRKEKLKGRCFNCLKRNHLVTDCPRKAPCFYCKRIGNHHRSLCRLNPKLMSTNSNNKQRQTVQNDVNLVSTNNFVTMQTAVVQIINEKDKTNKRIKVIFDSGSQRTYVTKKLVKCLNLKTFNDEELLVFNFGSHHPKSIKISYVKLKVVLNNGNEKSILASVVPNILAKPVKNPILEKVSKQYGHLKLADDSSFDQETNIDLLIGNDYYFDFINLEKIQVSDGLYLVDSKVGWILAGRCQEFDFPKVEQSLSFLTYANYTRNDCSLYVKPDLPLQKLETLDLKNFWDLELIGIKDNPHVSDDDKAMLMFNKSIRFHDDRYSVSWPWRDFPPELSPNYGLALGRLSSLIKKLKNNPDAFQKYNTIISEQLSKSIIEIVDRNVPTDNVVHYLPHHAVITPLKSTTKIRIVYDASAKLSKDNKSLNECLLRGRVLLEDLVGLLLRFRLNKYVVVCDIEKAFLQISLNDESRDVTRFIWIKDISKPLNDNNLVILRFTRIAFGIVCSPFLLGAVIKFHLNKENTSVAQMISENMYVDNVILSYNNEDDGFNIYKESKRIFSCASMNLREWSTNSCKLSSSLQETDRCNDEHVKVLGYKWNTLNDCLYINTGLQLSISSKREVLRYISSIFDPLGLTSPTLILGKIFMSKLWKESYDWDDAFSPIHQNEWNKIFSKIEGLDRLKIRRSIGFIVGDCTELHCYTDASKHAYAAVVYLRYLDDDLRVKCSIVMAKARISPANVSIPRLELLGVLIGIRLLKFVISHLKITNYQTYLWTDSKCVLSWLTTKRPLTLFVERRLIEIKNMPNVQFRYVSSGDNPSDYATRGLSCDDLAECRVWWEGPQWLLENKIFWPALGFNLAESNAHLEEVLLVDSTQPLISKIESPFCIDETNFSALRKLLRITAACVQFISNLKYKTRNTTESYIGIATEMWDRYIQRKSFLSVIKDIQSKNENHLQRQLGLWIDTKQILRCRGRLEALELCDESKFPKLLPKNEYYTKLVIESYHQRLFHAGVSHTLASLRTEYWVAQGRSAVFKVVKSCLTCRKFESGPYKLPPLAPLPKFRITRACPFINSGIDYIGPLYIRDSQSNKVWIILFTCLVTRAIHLELVTDLSSGQFLLAFRRFTARRCLPKLIISDNAGQFKIGKIVFDKIWQMIITDIQVKEFSGNHGVSWKFIPEFSPWMGGVYERLVGLIKRCLRKNLGKASLTLVQVQTVIVEVEAILNSRPLTYVTAEGLGEEILTPAHFLKLSYPETDVCNIAEINKLNVKKSIAESWKKGKQLLDIFWESWKNNYLQSLREQAQIRINQKKPTQNRIPKIGEVVHVKGKKTPRIQWKMGKIVELNYSEDKSVRSVKLLMGNNEIITRPICDLYPIEGDIDGHDTFAAEGESVH